MLFSITAESGLDANGKPANTRTEAQKVAMRKLPEELFEQFSKTIIVSHNVFNPMKACPCFNVMEISKFERSSRQLTLDNPKPKFGLCSLKRNLASLNSNLLNA